MATEPAWRNTCNISTQDAMGGELRIQGRHRLHSENLSQKQNIDKCISIRPACLTILIGLGDHAFCFMHFKAPTVSQPCQRHQLTRAALQESVGSIGLELDFSSNLSSAICLLKDLGLGPLLSGACVPV